MKRFSIVILLISSIVALGCANTEPESAENKGVLKAGEDTTVSLDFPVGDATAYDAPRCGAATYPCPPYGTKLYQRIENFPFIPMGASADTFSGEGGIAWMEDLYKFKEMGYEIMLLTISTGWCSYCSAQAGVLSSSIARDYAGKVLFLTVVVQDASGYDATAQYAESYMNSKNLDGFNNVVVSYDPAGLFQRYMNIQAFPFNGWINLTTMELMGYDSTLMDVNTFSSSIESNLSKAK